MATVHLIDNDPLSVFLTSEVMAKHQGVCYCVVSETGADALASIQAEVAEGRALPNLLILDIHLPGPNEGWKVLDALVAALPGQVIPTVILTAFISQRDRERAAGYPNVLGVYQKPFSRTMLHGMLELLHPQGPCTG